VNDHGATATGVSLAGKVVLVTGAARGIGEAIARRSARAGATVVVTDLLDEAGRAVADSLGTDASFESLDVADEQSWHELATMLTRRFGGIDALVNNAGVLHTATIADTTVDDYLRLVSVNQLGCFLGLRTAAPLLTARGGGSIVNLSSALGMVGMAGMVAYTATKFAIRGMTKAAAVELGPMGIRVNSVHPTGVITPMSDPARFGRAERDVSRIPLRRLADVDEIAQLVAFLASDASSYCTGSEFVIDGGVLAGQAT
jgi:3alpha(or 20beta)-hydroxysteroid dehydrogenase